MTLLREGFFFAAGEYVITIDPLQPGIPDDICFGQALLFQEMIQVFCQRVSVKLFLIVHEKALQAGGLAQSVFQFLGVFRHDAPPMTMDTTTLL